jgi:hypothetical protein
MFENSLFITTKNTLPLDYKDHSVNAAQENNLCEV